MFIYIHTHIHTTDAFGKGRCASPVKAPLQTIFTQLEAVVVLFDGGMYLYTCIHVCMCTYMHAFMCVCVPIYMYSCVCVCMQTMFTE